MPYAFPVALSSMAVTYVTGIKSGLRRALKYIVNPQKTALDGLHSDSDYETAKYKTYAKFDGERDPEWHLVYGINCNVTTAFEEMTAVHKEFGKRDGNIAYHGYQCFAPGEATPEIVHEIGIRLAQELWGDRFQVVVATHFNNERRLHSHFVFNSVSMIDGQKFRYSTVDYYKMHSVSDRLCREYGFSVIEKPQYLGINHAEYEAEKNGQPTVRGQIRYDVDRAVSASATATDFFEIMREMGYEFRNTGDNGRELKYPVLIPPGSKKYYTFHHLGRGYDYDSIIDRVYTHRDFSPPFPDEPNISRHRYRGSFNPHRKVTGLQAKYFYYCYKLKIIKKHPASQRRVHYYLRQDLTKLDRLDEETRLLGRTKIDSIQQLDKYRDSIKTQMQELIDERTVFRKAVAKGDESARERASEITEKLKPLRKELSICDRIEERSKRIQTVLEFREKEMEEMKYEYIGRSGRTGREDEPQRS